MYDHNPNTYNLVLEARYLLEALHNLDAAAKRGETIRIEYYQYVVTEMTDTLHNLVHNLKVEDHV